MQRAGFFRELPHGDPDASSLHGLMRDQAMPYVDRVLFYLEAAPTLIATGSMVDDVLNPSQEGVAREEIATDGEWLWPRDLAYYVKQYNVDLPGAFVQHMRDRGWKPRHLSMEQLIEVEEAMLGAHPDLG